MPHPFFHAQIATFDMPIAVLSCLSLGMAVDFSIHFIGRLRQYLAEEGLDGRRPSAESLHEALLWTASRPGRGILRNAVLFAAIRSGIRAVGS